jgi:hypothetical protein
MCCYSHFLCQSGWMFPLSLGMGIVDKNLLKTPYSKFNCVSSNWLPFSRTDFLIVLLVRPAPWLVLSILTLNSSNHTPSSIFHKARFYSSSKTRIEQKPRCFLGCIRRQIFQLEYYIRMRRGIEPSSRLSRDWLIYREIQANLYHFLDIQMHEIRVFLGDLTNLTTKQDDLPLHS